MIPMIQTLIQPAVTGLLAAVKLLRQGQLVAFPTETVYGLGADARRADAIQKIYQAKDRPPTNPLIVHVPDLAAARACVSAFPPVAQRLAEKFWPGPLTLVLPRGPSICPLVSAGRSTVAVRCPRHKVADALLRTFNGPIAAPSANRSGFISPTRASHVYAELNGRIPLILDGGETAQNGCEIGVESTVVDVSTNHITLLRPGGITLEMLREVVGPHDGGIEVFHGSVAPGASAAAPGMLDRHYAPRTPARRFTLAQWPDVQAWAQQQNATGAKLILLTHRDDIILEAPQGQTMLLPSAAPAYARILYESLRLADTAAASTILVLLPDKEDGMWHAVHDRLRRATVSW